MQRDQHVSSRWLQRWHLSLFEKVLLVNSLMLVVEAIAGVWVTSHHLEAQHYLIDTSFIVLATLLTLFVNIFLLRMSFQPLFGLLSTIREVSAGNLRARADGDGNDDEIVELANAFNSMLDRLEQAHREQTRLILQAQEDERRRIGLELHDEAGQNLTALLVHTEVLQQTLQAVPDASIQPAIKKQLEGGLQQLSTLTQGTLENIRILAQQLRPGVLEDLGLLSAFRWLVEDSKQRLHLQVTLHASSFPTTAHPLPPSYETALFRIAQESLTNIARHAQAQQASLTLCQEQEHIRLEIQDDGRGYLPPTEHAGLGIFGMRERTSQLGGTFSIQAQSSGGTLVQALLPLPIEEPVMEQPVPLKEQLYV
jgi:two-component system, NarL family, sensor histidine kinase UhpB